ncbi:MAG TPA: hypothetical protein VIG69_10255 [Candidatus Methylomirabilis sp.]|jgi:hypothetical protein
MTRFRWAAWILGAGAALAAALVACGRRAEHIASPSVKERTFHPAPLSVPVEAGLVAGEIQVLTAPGPESGAADRDLRQS